MKQVVALLIMAILVGGCGGEKGESRSPSDDDGASSYSSQAACDEADRVDFEDSNSEIHKRLLDAYVLASEASPTVKEKLSHAVDVFGGGPGDVTVALIDVIEACGDARRTEDW